MEVGRILLDHGAQVNTFNKYNCSALIRAAKEGSLEMAKFLIDSGASINATRNSYRTALMQASFYG